MQIAEFRNRAALRCVAQRRTRRDSGANPIQIKLSKNARNVGSKGVTRVYYIHIYIYIYVYICASVLAQKYANAILSLGDIYNNYNNNEGT